MGEYTCNLIQEGLVTPIAPSNFLHKIPNFYKSFIDFVDNPNYPVTRDCAKRKRLQTFTLHFEKINPIIEELQNRGLAKSADYPLCEVEQYTANQFMMYLAGCLGKLPEINSYPITDNLRSFNSLDTASYKKRRFNLEREGNRATVLNGILPAPNVSKRAREIAEFKSNYGDELLCLRNKVESFLIEAENIHDQSLRSEAIGRFISMTQDNIKSIEKRMKDNDWRNITFGRLLRYSSAALISISAVATLSNGVTPLSILGAVGAAFAVDLKHIQPIQNTKVKIY